MGKDRGVARAQKAVGRDKENVRGDRNHGTKEQRPHERLPTVLGEQAVEAKEDDAVEEHREGEEMEGVVRARMIERTEIAIIREELHELPRPEERKEEKSGTEEQDDQKCFAKERSCVFTFVCSLTKDRECGIEQERREQIRHVHRALDESVVRILHGVVGAQDAYDRHIRLAVERGAEEGEAVR